MVAVMIYPIWAVSGSLIEYTQNLAAILEDGSIRIPPPNESIKSWPVIGHKIYDLWAESSQSITKTLDHYENQVISLSSTLLQGVASFGFTMLQFLFAVIISGVLLANREGGITSSRKLMHKLVGNKDVDFLPIIGSTIRSVSQGVIGIAVIQAVLAYIGFWLAGVPGASFWALGVLVLAIIQMPPTLVILPIIIYVFYTSSTMVGVVFCIYSIAVSVSDSFLKPVFLGRGVDVPMLVILIGSLGGMFAFGIIGLFIGPIILAITFKLYQSWLQSIEESNKS
jgi:predicted PurR-regulated permease PerM